MYININECIKVCNVVYYIFQNYIGFQVGDGFYIFFKGCGFEFGMRVVFRFIQFFENVFYCRDIKGVVDEFFRVEFVQ